MMNRQVSSHLVLLDTDLFFDNAPGSNSRMVVQIQPAWLASVIRGHSITADKLSKRFSFQRCSAYSESCFDVSGLTTSRVEGISS